MLVALLSSCSLLAQSGGRVSSDYDAGTDEKARLASTAGSSTGDGPYMRAGEGIRGRGADFREKYRHLLAGRVGTPLGASFQVRSF